uniref:L-asparaginase n=1 Tax=Candidatus Kentrum eta TaxID=2126337 RepID=A0A450USG2_9GAMM|nr:MAG: L-asparaginase [Candidatus Kentron sp. H]VFJ88257.1 MAG: L-asparaginase [Candidatus Kentron sp. H]VFJ95478.1 MAG: L-asparaginase [Candidatus Kentron sp. H]
MAKREPRILVLIVGGNIGLYAEPNRNKAMELRPATPEEIKSHLMGEENDRLILREKDLEGEKVRIGVEALDTAKGASRELKDSSGIDPEQWQLIADRIHKERGRYDGFVVLHGLDTMAYTASAVSFMLRYLSVPIIFTGSQLPLNFARTDALQNILCAITLAAQRIGGEDPVAVIPEVCIFAHDTLFRANRTRMSNPSSYQSFASSNYPPLAQVGEYLDIQSHLIHSPSRQLMRQRREVHIPVHILDVYPGIDARVLDHLFKGIPSDTQKEIGEDEHPRAGLLLRTYGMGTAPISSGFLEGIEALTRRGVVVMAISQAHMGHLSLPRDPVSLRLLEYGVIFGADMTAEAAYAKMKVFLSSKDPITKVKEALLADQCGEQSRSLLAMRFDEQEPTGNTEEERFTRILEAKVSGDWHLPRRERIRQVQLRLLGVKPKGDLPKKGPPVTLELDVEVIDQFDGLDKVECMLLRDTLRWNRERGAAKERDHAPLTENRAIDITHQRSYVTGGETLLRISAGAELDWNRIEIVFYMDVHGAG